MNKINYNLEMEKIVGDFTEVKTLLLHSCCGPCSSAVMERLTPYFHIYIYFYNPNIHPEEEYYKRLGEQKRIIEESNLINPVEIVEAPYIPMEYFNTIKGYENYPEGSIRCHRCYEFRMRKSAEVAKSLNLQYFTTTLSVSPHKDSQILNALGRDIEDEIGVKYLYSDFKKKEGYKRSIELSREHNLYRQDYCGCIYSKGEV